MAKIAGNMMIALAIEALAEAAALTESYGLKAEDFFGIVTSTIFENPAYKSYADNIASGSYESESTSSSALKTSTWRWTPPRRGTPGSLPRKSSGLTCSPRSIRAWATRTGQPLPRCRASARARRAGSGPADNGLHGRS